MNMNYKRVLSEELEIGDEILMGRFKNKPAVVEGFGVDEKGQPTVQTSKGEVKKYKFRIKKLMED